MFPWAQILWTVTFLAIFNGHESRRRLFRDCVDERLKVREQFADVVITGTVKRVYGKHDAVYGGEVQVKRVIKGDHIKVGESLLVEGFGNSAICYSKVREKDSKMFLLNQLQTGSFRLNSSLLQMNVPNLERISAAVKDVPYRRRVSIVDEPCEKKFCPFNGDCNEENRLPVCRCHTTCKHSYSPICGSDGVTYTSECQMRVDTCRKQKRVYVRQEGICSR